MARIARALGADDAPGGLYDLAAVLGSRRALADLGLSEADLAPAAEAAAAAFADVHPRAADEDELRALLDDAFHGRRPGAV